jgi:hypothetical protein
MAVDFIFEQPTFDIPTKEFLRNEWSNVPNKNIVDVVAGEEQYLIFQRFLLENLYHTKEGCQHSPPYKHPLGLNVRAGAVKAAILLTASIAEAVLRAHAEKRNFQWKDKEEHRTFGKVLNVWKQNNQPHPDISEIWKELQGFRDARNNVHLFKAADNPEAVFNRVLEAEEKIFKNIDKVLLHLKKLVSP